MATQPEWAVGDMDHERDNALVGGISRGGEGFELADPLDCLNNVNDQIV